MNKIGKFGAIEENGQWPPHLHFQLMCDIEGNQGDYPGACRFSEKEKYLNNIPNPQLILNFPKAINLEAKLFFNTESAKKAQRPLRNNKN